MRSRSDWVVRVVRVVWVADADITALTRAKIITQVDQIVLATLLPLNCHWFAAAKLLLSVTDCYSELFAVISKLDLTSVWPNRSKGRNVNRDKMEMKWSWNGLGMELEKSWIWLGLNIYIMRSWPGLKNICINNMKLTRFTKNQVDQDSKIKKWSWPGV